jgi:hypothetical protein
LAASGSMSLPEAFQNELLAWLDARLSERFARQQRTLLEAVIKTIEAMLNEQLRLGGEVCKLELGEEFARLQDAVDRQQSVVADLQDLVKKLQHLDRAAHGEHSTTMN